MVYLNIISLLFAVVLLLAMIVTACSAAPASAPSARLEAVGAPAAAEQRLFSPSDVIGTVLQLQANDARREANFFCRFLPNCRVATQQKVKS